MATPPASPLSETDPLTNWPVAMPTAIEIPLDAPSWMVSSSFMARAARMAWITARSPRKIETSRCPSISRTSPSCLRTSDSWMRMARSRMAMTAPASAASTPAGSPRTSVTSTVPSSALAGSAARAAGAAAVFSAISA